MSRIMECSTAVIRLKGLPNLFILSDQENVWDIRVVIIIDVYERYDVYERVWASD